MWLVAGNFVDSDLQHRSNCGEIFYQMYPWNLSQLPKEKSVFSIIIMNTQKIQAPKQRRVLLAETVVVVWEIVIIRLLEKFSLEVEVPRFQKAIEG